ncbi:hypothetical protein FJZ33_00655 [Candidatus Poribacteria bacterium]|nr:hypothetical protein [Candidatus Poribacteria bacterium]
MLIDACVNKTNLPGILQPPQFAIQIWMLIGLVLFLLAVIGEFLRLLKNKKPSGAVKKDDEEKQ